VIDLLFDGAIFYAIIDGPTATGSITDPDVCGSQKRFTWRARRVSR
jgi:hypothetical protein